MAPTRKSIQQRVQEALAIEAQEAYTADAAGYMARVLTQSTIPHVRVNESVVRRSNGFITITISNVSGSALPWGSYPRLLLAWMTIEAIQTKSPLIEFGPTLSGFMTELGLLPTGGRWGTITQLRDQMVRLFSSSIACHYSGRDSDSGAQLLVARDYNLWWDPKQPDQAALWGSSVRLSTDFFDAIVDSPMVVSMSGLRALKQSPMALDVYWWFAYRYGYLRSATAIPWEALYLQFGNGFPDTVEGLRDFKKQFRHAADRVRTVLPTARFESDRYYFTLVPAPAQPAGVVKKG